MQWPVLRIELISQPVVQRKVGPDLPGVLHVGSSEGPGLHVLRVSETLLVERRESEAPRLQSADTRFRCIDTAGCRKRQTRTDQKARKVEKFKTAREKGLRSSVVAANKLLESHLPRMVSVIERQVGERCVAAPRRATRKKYAAAKETEVFHVEPRAAEIIGAHVKLVQVPLHEKFVLGRGAELMKPRALHRAVPGQFRSAAGLRRQSLYVRVPLREMDKAVAKKAQIAVAEAVIETRGKIILAGGKWKQPPVALELIHKVRIQRPLDPGNKWIRAWGGIDR